MKIGTRGIAAGAALALTAGLTATTTAGPATAGPDPGATGTQAAVQKADPQPGKGRPDRTPPKEATATGYGGAVSTVDENATAIGLEVLRKGGNAADAAVAAAAALGVTEPYSAGVGGGGYFVHYDADTGEIETIDGRETAPASMPTDAFIDPETGSPYRFFPDLVTSGASVGVPGTPATWEAALEEWGTLSYKKALRPATKLARKGFVVDETFRSQTLGNAERFAAFTSTSELFLPGGDAPEVGSTFKNHDLAATYRLLATHGNDAFYGGQLAADMVQATQEPPTTDDTDLPVPPGFLELEDLAGYEEVMRQPAHSDYRGYDVYGMPPSSSGGTTVGEALNVLEQYDVGAKSDLDALHLYLEAGALAFADRAAYLGDPAYVDVPVAELLDDTFAAERSCAIDPDQAMPKPTAAGDVSDYDGECEVAESERQVPSDTESESTTNLTVADRWGNVVEYTLTIEQTGGSGIVVPGRGFLLNNELTDFSHVYDEADPNRIQPGKRPRSSMSPTIVLEDGKPFLALGTPGGSTIITTVLQMIFNRVDRGMSVEESIAAPRSAPRNGPNVTSEPAFIDAYGAGLTALGHAFNRASEIGAATAIEFGPDGLLTAVAEPERRGGGAAAVLEPR